MFVIGTNYCLSYNNEDLEISFTILINSSEQKCNKKMFKFFMTIFFARVVLHSIARAVPFSYGKVIKPLFTEHSVTNNVVTYNTTFQLARQ